MQALIRSILGRAEFDSLPNYFMETVGDDSESPGSDIYTSNDAQFSIIFDTVYGVKGETHDATLYLEIEGHNGSDIQRIIKLFKANTTGKTVSDTKRLLRKK